MIPFLSVRTIAHSVMAREKPEALFNGTVFAITRGSAQGGWRVWRPSDPALPPPEGVPTLECMAGKYRPARQRKQWQPQPMCLAHSDKISLKISRFGEWHDCAMLVRWWHRMELGAATFLELGANIGACTIALLLDTEARIIAFEPSPINQFYLTRSLQLAARRYPSIAERVVVYPLAAGDAWAQAPLFAESKNLGNSVLGTAITDACSGTDKRWHGSVGSACANSSMTRLSRKVIVSPIDDLFPDGLGAVALIKMDVQGFECNVLRGARIALARSRRLQAIFAELSALWLNAQCCAQLSLVHLLKLARPDWTVSCALRAWTTDGTCIGHADTGTAPLLAQQGCRASRNQTRRVLYSIRRERRRIADRLACRAKRVQGELALTDSLDLRRVHEQTRAIWRGSPLQRCDYAALAAAKPPCDIGRQTLLRGGAIQLSHALFERRPA